MKLAIILAIVIAMPLTALAKNKAEKKIPIEEDAQIYEEIKDKNDLIQALANAVNLYGYKCDSISAARPFIMSRGYILVCNRYAYEYKIEDKGGRMIITVD